MKHVSKIEQDLTRKGHILSYRGYTPSRLDPNIIVGSKEYYDPEYNIGWPEGYAEHYISKHNVMPTERFFNYVMSKK